ncbi:unnamed protein product [Leuciscus chuanchicus]
MKSSWSPSIRTTSPHSTAGCGGPARGVALQHNTASAGSVSKSTQRFDFPSATLRQADNGLLSGLMILSLDEQTTAAGRGRLQGIGNPSSRAREDESSYRPALLADTLPTPSKSANHAFLSMCVCVASRGVTPPQS